MRKLTYPVLTVLTATAAAVGLVACETGATSGPPSTEGATPEPALVTDVAAADATIEPASWSELRFEADGVVAALFVQEGQTVAVGDVVGSLDSTAEELAVKEAEAALASARAQLALLDAGARAEEIAAAEAELEDAEAALERASAQRDEVVGGATAADIAAALAEVTAAEGEWLRARDDRDELFRNTEEGNADDMKERDQANYRFAAAIEALDAARTKLTAVRNTADDRVAEAEARVASAAAQVEVAEAELALVSVGAEPWEIVSAEADVAQKEVALKAAEASLARSVLLAPFEGTVTRVDVEVGDLVDTSQVVAVLATLDRLEARTVDLTELDVARVREGQTAVVTPDALPGVELKGRVRRIGLRSVDYRGDVTYPVTVELEAVASELRWGMTALVEIELES
jgi:multidrug efflux pump subunit AcrA (membrane-fusion protein)